MREQYQTMSVAALRELAKTKGMKGISALKKDQLIDRILQEDQKNSAAVQGEKPQISQSETIKISQTAKKDAAPSEKPQAAPGEKPQAAQSERPQAAPNGKPQAAPGEKTQVQQSMKSLPETSGKPQVIPNERSQTAQEKPAEASEKGRNNRARQNSYNPQNMREQQNGYRTGNRKEYTPQNRENREDNQRQHRPQRTFNAANSGQNRTVYNNSYQNQSSQSQGNGGYNNQKRRSNSNSNDTPNSQQNNYSNNQQNNYSNNQQNNYSNNQQNNYSNSQQNNYLNNPQNNYQNSYSNNQQNNYSNNQQNNTSYNYSGNPAGSSYGDYSNQIQEKPARTYPQPAPEPDIEQQMREADAQLNAVKEDLSEIDSGLLAKGILELHTEGYGFIRSDNYMPGDNDVYVSPSQIRRFNLKTGDIISGNTRVKSEKEKFSALLYVTSVNGRHPSEAQRRPAFEQLTPVFPDERLRMERPGGSVAMRVVDVVSPVGKGQRGMIVSQPKAGKTTLLKEMAKSITHNNPEMKLIILLIDERPEEVTDIKESIEGPNVEVIYSTFDETPEHHKRVAEMVIERAKRLVEYKEDVIILLDSITRLARAYNLTCQPSGRTLSGGLDPAALHMPKKFFGAARNMREGGSLTILATALVDTGSKMDDVVYEEFKGTGNMELVLDRKLSEKRIFPAIDIVKSGTRREDLLLDQDEQAAVDNMRRAFNGMKADEAVETILNMFAHTKNNTEFINMVRKTRIL